MSAPALLGKTKSTVFSHTVSQKAGSVTSTLLVYQIRGFKGLVRNKRGAGGGGGGSENLQIVLFV